LALKALADVERRMGRLDKAHQALDAALSLFRQSGDALDQAAALAELATLKRDTGDLAGAIENFNEAARLFAGAGDVGGQGAVLLGLARIEAARNKSQAKRHYEHAVDLLMQAGLADLAKIAVAEHRQLK
jgi:tetratricopeptide (TPR) repeat protein